MSLYVFENEFDQGHKSVISAGVTITVVFRFCL